jgi:hypothetical protein
VAVCSVIFVASDEPMTTNCKSPPKSPIV